MTRSALPSDIAAVTSAAQWKIFVGCHFSTSIDVALSRAVGLPHERFHMSAADAARVTAIAARLKGELLKAIAEARVIDTERSRTQLAVVVDNI